MFKQNAFHVLTVKCTFVFNSRTDAVAWTHHQETKHWLPLTADVSRSETTRDRRVSLLQPEINSSYIQFVAGFSFQKAIYWMGISWQGWLMRFWISDGWHHARSNYGTFGIKVVLISSFIHFFLGFKNHCLLIKKLFEKTGRSCDITNNESWLKKKYYFQW